MDSMHKSKRNHMMAKRAYEKKYPFQKYENSPLYTGYFHVIDEIIKLAKGDV